MELVIAADGTLRCVYGEAIDVSQIGSPTICRASHVEPDSLGQWHADLAPVGGPLLGPFSRRSDALSAEAAWLHAHWITG